MSEITNKPIIGVSSPIYTSSDLTLDANLYDIVIYNHSDGLPKTLTLPASNTMVDGQVITIKNLGNSIINVCSSNSELIRTSTTSLATNFNLSNNQGISIVVNVAGVASDSNAHWYGITNIF